MNYTSSSLQETLKLGRAIGRRLRPGDILCLSGDLGAGKTVLTKGIALISGDYQYMITYEFTKLNEIKPQMIEEATKNARAAAEKFASDSDSELGKIKRANQGQFSITNRDNNTPDIKRVRVVTTVDYYLED